MALTRYTLNGRDNWHNPSEAHRHDARATGKTGPCSQQRAADIRWLKLIAVICAALLLYWLGGR